MNNQLHKKIMRRVYYAYALRVATEPVVLHGFSVLALMIVMTYFVSLGHVIQNMMGMQLGDLGSFVLRALTNTEAWTLFIIGGLIFALFSLRFSLGRGSHGKLSRQLA